MVVTDDAGVEVLSFRLAEAGAVPF